MRAWRGASGDATLLRMCGNSISIWKALLSSVTYSTVLYAQRKSILKWRRRIKLQNGKLKRMRCMKRMHGIRGTWWTLRFMKKMVDTHWDRGAPLSIYFIVLTYICLTDTPWTTHGHVRRITIDDYSRLIVAAKFA